MFIPCDFVDLQFNPKFIKFSFTLSLNERLDAKKYRTFANSTIIFYFMRIVFSNFDQFLNF